MTTNGGYEQLARRVAEIQDLNNILLVLAWDQRVKMPPRGGPARAEQLATVSRLAHEKLVAGETGRLLDELRAYEESLEYDSDEASLIRMVRRDYEKARRVPAGLRSAMVKAASEALPVWDEARRTSDFKLFLPSLRRNFELRREFVACFDDYEDPYDVLLDEFEPGMKTSEVRAVFDTLKEELRPLIAGIAEREQVDDAFLRGPFAIERQWRLEHLLLERLGFTSDAWRIDETVHPFASNSGTGDIRITTRHRENSLDSFFSTLHEFGHGLYEHQVSPSLERTTLCRGASLGMHESQSRMWENLVGRSLPFWRGFYKALQDAFPEQLAGVELDRFYRGVNKVAPSLIRIESDEATYNMHIILRFELEQELLNSTLELADAAEAWDARMRDYLGVEVPDVADGVLQDMHWAGGHIGYFATYSLGNVISVQLWERLRQDLPDLDDQIERGDFAPLREWLGEHVHRHGRKLMPAELLERVVGRSLDARPYLAYLKQKLGEIYGLPVAA